MDLIGAAASIAEMNGVEKASHIKNKLVQMSHLNETIYATGIASSYQGYKTKSGCFQCDDMLSNVCKHHVTKMPFEMAQISQDLARLNQEVIIKFNLCFQHIAL